VGRILSSASSLIGSTYRWPFVDMLYIDMPHIAIPSFSFHLSLHYIDMPCIDMSCFRLHLSLPHIDMPRIHGHVTHITIHDGTITPRIQLPSLNTPSTQYLSSQIQVLSRELLNHTRRILTRHVPVIPLTHPCFPPVATPHLSVAPRRI
jgi:hypothetical protein